MDNCIFCKIINHELNSERVYEDDNVIAIKDINPMTDIHILFIHKVHSNNINEMNSRHIIDIFSAIKDYTIASNIADFRIMINKGKGAGQTVFHTHFHLLSGDLK